jgi:glycosyltransferase involved in cell wall biosynthesis
MITVSASFSQYFLNKYGVKTLLLKNGPINVKDLNRRDFFREKLNIPQSSKILLYQGVFNTSRGLEKLVKSAYFFDRHIQLILLGGGPLENDLKLLSENSENIHFHPMVSQEVLFDYTSSADIGILLIEAKNKSKELTLPNKVFEYMSAGIPFITNFLPEGALIVKKHNCGFIIQDETPEIIAQEINRIFKEDYDAKGINGFDAIKGEYLWNIDFDNMIKHLTN